MQREDIHAIPPTWSNWLAKRKAANMYPSLPNQPTSHAAAAVEPSKTKTPFIYVLLAGLMVQALVDTGANVNLVSEDVYKRIQRLSGLNHYDLMPVTTSTQTVDGSQMK